MKIPEIQFTNYAAEKNIELCTVGNIILSSTKIGLSVVNCSKPMLLYTFCSQKAISLDDKSIDGVSLNTQHHGYSLHSHNESHILTAKHTCGGFTHMIGDTCFMFIQYKNVIDHQECQYHVMLFSCFRRQLFAEITKRNMQIHKELDTVCRKAVNDSLYYVENNHWYLPNWINNFIKAYYPLRVVLTGAQIIKSRLGFCETYPLCPHFPSTRLTANHDLNDPQFVICSRPREMFNIMSPPDMFTSFRCNDGSLIASASHCDGYNDCSDSEDEHNCTDVCSLNTNDCFTSCIQPSCVCHEFYYQCESGGCIQYDKFCNGIINCKYGDDETNCLKDTSLHPSINVSSAVQYIDSDFCYGGFDFLPCYSRTECFPIASICHYDSSNGVLTHCADGTHIYGPCDFIACNDEFKCFQSYCIMTRKVCDGMADCPDADDEAHCENMSCPGHLRCYKTSYCVPPSEICDGTDHCPGGDDEHFCQHCPQGCECKGNMMSCSYVEQQTIILDTSPAAFTLHHSNALFYHIINTQADKLKSVYHVSLDNGDFQVENKLSSMSDFKSLQFLQITNQKVKQLSPNFIKCVLLQKLNMSFNMIHTINENAFSCLENLKILILISNNIEVLEWHFVKELQLQQHIDLSNNPLFEVSPDVFTHTHNLLSIRSDWYMTCCVAIHVHNCRPKGQFVSSCSHLISSVIQKVTVILQGPVATIANCVVLASRLFRREGADNVIMLNLVTADTFMGLYLIILSCVDFFFHGRFHELISQWTLTAVCWTEAMLNFVSSETSLMILVILSIARTSTMKKIGGLRLVKKKMFLACVFAWVITVGSVSSYMAYLYMQRLRLRNNMCIILGISHKRSVSWFEYIVQAAVVTFNDSCVLVLTTCSFGLYLLVVHSTKSVAQPRYLNDLRSSRRFAF